MLKKLFFTVAFLTSNLVNAAIQDLGVTTLDESTGLKWLDVTATRGMTYIEVLSELGDGGIYEGWRYATVSELEQLISNFGYTPENSGPCNFGTTYCDTGLGTNNAIIPNMIRTLGDTYDEYLDETNSSFDTRFGSAWSTIGIVDASKISPNSAAFSTIADQDAVYRLTGDTYADWSDHVISYHFPIDYPNVNPRSYGSYLVSEVEDENPRDEDIPFIPIWALGILFGLFLIKIRKGLILK